MTESTPATSSPTGPNHGHNAVDVKSKMPPWLFRVVLGASAAVALVVIYLIASVTVPLLWANAIRDQIGGQLGNSIPLGMFYGFVFTFVPLLIAWQARRNKLNKWVRISLIALAVLLLIPNLLTLAVMYGSSGTAADARTIWANSANWFGMWSQIFMVVGVLCAIGGIFLTRMWLRRGAKIREIKAAEKLIRNSEIAKERAAKEAARAAEKAAKAEARGHRRASPAGLSKTDPEADTDEPTLTS